MKSKELKEQIVIYSVCSLGLYFLAFLAFTKGQKETIKARDREFGIKTNKGGCQFPDKHSCNGDKQVHIHHILPGRYARSLGLDPDFIENGITLCQYSHMNLIHPDMREAMHNYHKDKSSFDKAFQARDELLQQKKTYWNTTWDRTFSLLAKRRSQRASNTLKSS